MIDFAKRVHDHSYKLDPIIRCLEDEDFYKFSMCQQIHMRHFNTVVAFGLKNRSADVRLADIISESELREQLDHARTLRFSKSFLIWLRGQTFYGREGIFKQPFIDFLARLQLPEYELNVDREAGQFHFRARGRWCEVMWWETIAMRIVNELRYRALMREMPRSTLDIIYSRAKVKLYAKLERLAELDELNLSDFGTRRRHSFLWQQHAVQTAAEVLGKKFSGTSNVLLAYRHGLEAIGTNAHELPMVLAAMAGNDDVKLKAAQYQVLQDWQTDYRDNMLIFLPDTFGTTQFLRNAPQFINFWRGARPDSKEPIAGGEELITFWKNRCLDPMKKMIVFSDGLDVAIPGHEPNGADIPTIHRHFDGKVGRAYGWGTMLTNDFLGCVPKSPDLLKPISLVCKVTEANGRPTVKLSDNPTKATGPKDEIERYLRVFGAEGQKEKEVLV